MTVKTSQDIAFINSVRSQATAALNVANTTMINQAEWLTTFSGPDRLTTGSFADNNEGLAQANISAAQDILNQFVAWLDEPGQNRRGYLMAVANL